MIPIFRRLLGLGLIAVLLVGATAPVFAKEKVEGGVAVAESSGTKRGLLWKAKSSKGTVWLFGSIHLANESMYPLPRNVEQAFERAENLVVEVNAGPEQQAQLAAIMATMGTYPADVTLSDSIPQDLLGQLTSYLTESSMPLEAVNRWEPWLVALTITAIELHKLGLDPTLGIEQHFLRKVGDKSVIELETAEQQLALFDELGVELQQQMLHKTLLDAERIAEEMDEMISAWSRGDVDAIEAFMYKSLEEAPELAPLFQKLFTDRNLTMTEKIAGFLDTGGTYFVLVGAGHLVGDDGIVALLKKQKFSVKRQ